MLGFRPLASGPLASGPISGATVLVGDGTLRATATLKELASARLPGTGTLSVTVREIARASARLAGVGTLKVRENIPASAFLAGIGSLAVDLSSSSVFVVPFWPGAVPQVIKVDSYNETPEGNVVEFKPEVGPPKRRRRASTSTTVYTFATVMTHAELDAFFAFWRDDLKEGTLPFRRKKPRFLAGVDYEFQFAAVPTYRALSHDTGEVQMSMRLMPQVFQAGTSAFPFVAGGYNGNDFAVRLSADGISWIAGPSNPPTNGFWSDCADRSGMLVIAGSEYSGDGNPIISTSLDGITWTPRSFVFSGIAGGELDGVSCNGPLCVAVGVDYDTHGPIVLTSSDGLSWTQQTTSITDMYPFSVAYGGGTYVACGPDWNTGAQPRIISSTDAITWFARTPDPSSNATLWAVASNGSIFVVVGGRTISSPFFPITMRSTNGIAWSLQSNPLSASDALFRSVTWASQLGLFVAVGSQFNGLFNDPLIMTSPDGITWTVQPAVVTSGFDTIFNDVSFSVVDGLLAIVGWDSGWNGAVVVGIPHTVIYTSPDAVTWTSRTAAVFDDRLYFVLGR